MGVQKSKKGYRENQGRKGKEKGCNYIIISEKFLKESGFSEYARSAKGLLLSSHVYD